jgi:hypothetical protein
MDGDAPHGELYTKQAARKQLPDNYSKRTTWYWKDIYSSEATLDTVPRDADISGAREKHASENTVYAYIDMYVV